MLIFRNVQEKASKRDRINSIAYKSNAQHFSNHQALRHEMAVVLGKAKYNEA